MMSSFLRTSLEASWLCFCFDTRFVFSW